MTDISDPPYVTVPKEGIFLDAEPVGGIKNQFLSLEDAIRAAKASFPECRGITAESLEGCIVFTLRGRGPLVQVPEEMVPDYTTWMLRERARSSKFNRYCGYLLSTMNQLYSFFGLCIFALSIYVFLADWGALDSSFFHGVASIMLLFSVIVILTTYIGDKGSDLMMYPPSHDTAVEAKEWNGKQMLMVYFITLLGGFIFTFYIFVLSLSAIESVRENEAALAAGTVPALSYMEGKVAEKFNPFFFAAREYKCPNVKYSFLWTLTDTVCNADMQQIRCALCDTDYYINSCAADEKACYEGAEGLSSGDLNEACPYIACRQGILGYLVEVMEPLFYVVLSFMGYLLIVILLTLLLICFHPRDKWHKLEVKRGARPLERLEAEEEEIDEEEQEGEGEEDDFDGKNELTKLDGEKLNLRLTTTAGFEKVGNDDIEATLDEEPIVRL